MERESIKILSPLRLAEASEFNIATASSDIVTDGIQPDLLYMDSVLVSTGMNKNTDVFLASEMWAARKSPILKPVNWEHQSGKELVDRIQSAESKQIIVDNHIIGGMWNSFAAMKDGTPITDEMAMASDFEIPKDFDIINQAVVYKYLFPKVAEKIVKDARAGNLFVSMEAWFSNYDYQLGNKIVARNEETAFLDRCLRANGGDGSFKGITIGRVLRNIYFGGVGIVANPANVDSVIHSLTNASIANVELTGDTLANHVIGELLDASASAKSQEVIEIMSDNETNAPAPAVTHADYKGVVERLVKAELTIEQRDADVASSKAEVEKLQASFDKLVEVFDAGSQALAEVVGQEAVSKLAGVKADEFFTILAGVVTDKLAAGQEAQAALDEVKAQVAELETEKRQLARSTDVHTVLAEFIDDADDLAARRDKILASTRDLDDEAFAATLEDTKELLSVAMKKKAEDMKKDKKDDKKGGGGKPPWMDKKDASASDDQGITDPEVLNNVKAEASVPAGAEASADNQINPWDKLAGDLLGYSKA